MAVSYKKLWHILVDRNMKKKDLEEAAGITHYQMYKLANDKDITTDPTTSMCTKRRGREKTKPNALSSTTSSSGIWTLIPRSAIRATLPTSVRASALSLFPASRRTV